MKKVLYFLGAALLMLAVASCGKIGDDTPAPYFKVSTSWEIQSGTLSGKTDFSNIFAETNQYNNVSYKSESEALSVYNSVLAKTKDVTYTAAGSSFVELHITKYIATRESEHVIKYDADPNYKSPVRHIWDAKGSRDE